MLDDATQEKLNNNFTYHAPKGDQTTRYQELREAGKKVAELICKHVPESPERTNAVLKIEEAIFWANAGIARNE